MTLKMLKRYTTEIANKGAHP